MNHIVQREKEKGRDKGKGYALFIDLKAAFDNVNREKLWEIMEEKEISTDLIKRIRKIYEDADVRIRTKDGVTRGFSASKTRMCDESNPF